MVQMVPLRLPLPRQMLLLSLMLMMLMSNITASSYVWPVNGTLDPNMPQTSPFGPRYKYSESRYDWHRGIDIQIPVNTSLKAIADGVVRLAGDYPYYDDKIVQTKHPYAGGYMYANYIHLTSLATGIFEGANVTQGQVVGYSGVSVSGFAHLHFETRIGCIFQRCCQNPWGVLPYVESSGLPDILNTTYAPGSGSTKLEVTVTATVPATELTLDRIWLVSKNMNTGIETVLSQDLAFDELTRLFSANISVLDNPDIASRHLRVYPYRFNGVYGGWSDPAVKVVFREVPIPISSNVKIVAKAATVSGSFVSQDVYVPTATPTPTPLPSSGSRNLVFCYFYLFLLFMIYNFI